MKIVRRSMTLGVLFVLFVCSGCATRSDMRRAQSDISSIWDRLSFLSAENDEQDTKLTRLERGIIGLSLLDDTIFNFDSSRVSPPATRRLLKIGRILADYPGVKISIEGHTDSSGSEQHNKELSERRAQAVADVLIESGVKQSNILVRGYGESRPLATNSSSWGRKQNRRVEIAIQDGSSKENYERAQLEELD